MTAEEMKAMMQQIAAEGAQARARLWALDRQQEAVEKEREQLKQGLAALAGKFELCENLLPLLMSAPAPQGAPKPTEGARP
jgi:chromosome segregation ATPase